MRIALGILTALLLTHTSAAQEWNQWRGAARDGEVVKSFVPPSWPASVQHVWRVDVGEGYSSPIIAGGRVFVHSRRDPDEVVTAIDVASGKVVWQQQYPAPFAKNQYAVRMAKGPNSTPIVAGSHVYTLGATGVLSAWRVDNGVLAWRKDYSESVDTSKLFCGTAMSPMFEGGLLIVHVGSDVHGGRLVAIDPGSGAERWSWRGPGPGYASPITIAVDGTRQIVTMTNQSVVGIGAASGELLWSIPFPDEWHENIVTPVWTGAHLIVSGVRQGTQAFTLTKEGGAWRAAPAWKNADVTMYMSAPVFADGTLYGFSSKRKGQFTALDAKTGTVRWATEGREGDHASLLRAPSHIIFLTNAGELVIARQDPGKFAQERRLKIADGETWAVPVFVSGGIIVRDARGIVKVAWAN